MSGYVTTPPTNNTASGNETLPTRYGPELVARIAAASSAPFNVTTDGSYSTNSDLIFVGDGTTSTIDASAQATATVGTGATADFTSSQGDLGILIDGTGNTVTVGSGNNLIQAQIGGNKLVDTREAGGGQTTMAGGFGAVTMVSGSGHSVMFGGSEGGDVLKGGLFKGAHDTITAGIGGDVISTKAGHNYIYGNENDTIKAGNAQDSIAAGYSAETVTGGHSSVVFGGGETLMKGGNNDHYYMTGHDTMLGSSHDNAVTTTEGSNLFIDGRNTTGHIDVTLLSSKDANDTIFGGLTNGAGLTIHVQENFTEDRNADGSSKLDSAGAHVLRSASGQELHVTNVTIDFNNTQHYT